MPHTRTPLPWYHPITLLVTGGGLGFLPKAPGTFGTLLGFPFAALWVYAYLKAIVFFLQQVMPRTSILEITLTHSIIIALLVLVTTLLLSLGIIHYYLRHHPSSDPSEVVMDEYVSFALLLLVCSPSYELHHFSDTVRYAALAGLFVTFRLLDIYKPWPIKPCEKLPGALGVMADDLMVVVMSTVIYYALFFMLLDIYGVKNVASAITG